MSTFAIIGGGPVGGLAALALAKSNIQCQIDLYEVRKDSRMYKGYEGKSINLALSFRGKAALKKYGIMNLDDYGIPLDSRCIHDLNKPVTLIPYGLNGETILSISRQTVNELVLNQVDKIPNIRTFFQTKCTDSINGYDRTIEIQNTVTNIKETKPYDMVIGADGIRSTVRKFIVANSMNVTYEMTTISHSYKELYIPCNSNLRHNSLHIWPRKDFMMIALPNLDKSFTVTLFMPTEFFKCIRTTYDLQTFFQTNFPDIIDSMPTLYQDFFTNTTNPLSMVKSNVWHYKDFAIVLGDAAHGILPFYGQGLNSSLESVSIFGDMFNCDRQIDRIFEQFYQNRSPDTLAISKLSYDNYLEMRSHVIDKMFLFKQKLDNIIAKNEVLQNFLNLDYEFIPKYSMVAFSKIPYSEVIKRDKEQQMKIKQQMIKIIMFLCGVSTALIIKARL
jgi:kynurenine 3-monooxygenase